MSDPYDINAVVKQIAEGAQRLAAQKRVVDLARSVRSMGSGSGEKNGANALASLQAASRTGSNGSSVTPVGNSGGGAISGGGAVVDPTAAMTGAITALQGLSAAQIAELMEKIKANYAQYGGDLQTEGTDWLKALLGDNFNMNDPAVAAMMADPTIASFMGSMEQMQETGDQNLTTDLSWFLKQQAAYNQYLATLPALMTGTVAVSGGGGGGGGGGRGGGGYGGGSSSGEETEGVFDKQKAVLNIDSWQRSQAGEPWNMNLPGYMDTVLSGIDPGLVDEVMEIQGDAGAVNSDSFLGNLQEMLREQEEISARDQDTDISNAFWQQGVDSGLSEPVWLQQYLDIMGLMQGDDPDTEDIYEGYIPDPSHVPVTLTPQQAAQQAAFDPTFQMYYDPDNYGGVPGMGQEALAADYADVNTVGGRFRKGFGDTIYQEPSGVPGFYGSIMERLHPELFGRQQAPALNIENFMPPEEEAPSDAYIMDDTQLPDPESDWYYHNGPDISPNSTSYEPGWSDYMGIAPEDMTDAEFSRAYYNMPAMQQLRQYMFDTRGDPNARRAYWEDVYPNLRPIDRVVVDRALAISNVDIPNQAAANYQANNEALETESLNRRRQQALSSMVGQAIQGAEIVRNLMGQRIEDPNNQITQDQLLLNQRQDQEGNYREPFVDSLKRFSSTLGNSMAGILGDAFDPQPGEYWDSNPPTPEELWKNQEQENALTFMIDTFNNEGYNQNLDLVNTAAELDNSASETVSMNMDATDAEGELFDFNTLTPEELEAVTPTDANPFGDSGSGPYGFRTPSNSLMESLRRVTPPAAKVQTNNLQQMAANRISSPRIRPTTVGAPISTGKKNTVNLLRSNAKKKIAKKFR